MLTRSIDCCSENGPKWEDKKRVLFMPESASLAHLGRLLTLAQGLPQDRYDISFACDRSLRSWVPLAFQWHSSRSLPPQEFRDRMDRGQTLLDEELIRHQVNEDLALLSEIRPAAVIGDFRPSLAISAPLAGVHYINVVNAHWSPWSHISLKSPGTLKTWWGRALGHRLGKALVDTFLPLGCMLQSRPFNRVRQAYGLPPLPDNIRYIYAGGDTVLYPDLPKLSPTPGAPKSHQHIGPVLWEPPLPLPSWWNSVPKDRPCVFVSVGSTGQWETFERIVRVLQNLPVVTLVATSGRGVIESVPNQVFVADYLPGLETCKRADLMICNGGAGTVYQALSLGVPVLGVAANMDQMSVMSPVQEQRAGRCIPVGLANRTNWGAEIIHLLSSPSALLRAREIAHQMAGYSSAIAFQNILSQKINHFDFTSKTLPLHTVPVGYK